MTTSLVHWLTAAVLLFWAVGAYNRLVRLRGDASAAFGPLDAELGRQVDLVSSLVEADEPPQSVFEGTQPSFWGGLQGAAAQLQASLALARQKPLDPERIAALGSAQTVLMSAWERAERDDAHDLAGARLPDSLVATRAHLTVQCISAAERFAHAVEQYNAAVAQFPALLLAWMFGFKPGAALPPLPAPQGLAV